MKNELNKIVKAISEGKLVDYCSSLISKASQKLLYTVLLLFYAYKRKDTPSWAKNIIIGALTYFLSPIDSIPDLTPFLGLTDDMGVLSFGLVTIACYVNSDVRLTAKKKLKQMVDTIDEDGLKEVDSWL